jgi:serine/threonine protein kinase
MSCPERERLQLLLAGQLGGSALAEVEAHVEGCGRCQLTLEQLTREADWQAGQASSLESGATFLRPLMEGPPPRGFRSHVSGTADSLVAQACRSGQQRTPVRVAGYDILDELGRGVSGVVYKARQAASSRPVALKVLKPRGRSGFSVRFRREVQALAWLQHPHIVRIYEVGEHDGRPFLAMELADGSLDRRLKLGPLQSQVAVRLVANLARAIHAAHQQGIIHRDLKPANILLVDNGAHDTTAPFIAKIADFGLAKGRYDSDKYTHDGTIIGTPSYMAPEQASAGSAEVGPAADIYSLGAILYETLTGRLPFAGKSVPEVLERVRSEAPPSLRLLQTDLPAELDQICQKCLHKLPAGRYASALELAEDLERLLQAPLATPYVGPVRPMPPTAADLHALQWYNVVEVPPVERPQRRWQTWAFALVSVATLVLLVLAVTLHLRGRAAHKVLGKRPPRAVAGAADAQEPGPPEDAEPGMVPPPDEPAAQAAPRPPEEPVPAPQLLIEGLGVRHEGVRALAISPDGKRLVSGGPGLVRSLAVETGQSAFGMRPFKVKIDVSSLAFAPDGQSFASASADGTLVLQDTASGQMILRIPPGDDRPRVPTGVVTFSPDGKTLALGLSGKVRLLEARTGKSLNEIAVADGYVRHLAYTPDGRTLVANIGCTVGGGVRIWEAATGKERAFMATERLSSLAVSPDGRVVTAASVDGKIRLWELATQRELSDLTPGTEIGALVFGRDGRLLYAGGEDGTLQIWDWAAVSLQEKRRPFKAAVQALAFSGDGATLASAGDDTIILWTVGGR